MIPDIVQTTTVQNQSKNASVAFVTGDNERNDFFENIVMYDEQVRTYKAKD